MDCRIAVCIATYRRTEMARRLLESLCRVTWPDLSQVEIRVVDNDKEGSARSMVADALQSFPSEVSYAVEPRQSIAHARNCALDMGPADFYAFVDDDEVVKEDWLINLWNTIQTTGADAVFGPVEGRLPSHAPQWMSEGGFFNKETGPDGTPLDWRQTRTSNTFVRGTWITDRNMRFDPRFGRSGSSDSDFFHRMELVGGRFASAGNAGVWEDVEPERASLGWLLRRNYRNGLTFHALEQASAHSLPGPLRAATRLVKAAGTCVMGLPLALIGRPAKVLRGICILALAAGGAAAWLRPTRVDEYVEYGTRASEGADQDANEGTGSAPSTPTT